MQPNTMSLKNEGRPLFLFYLILFKIHNLQRGSFPGTGIGFRPSLASGPVPVLIVFYPPYVSCQVSLAPNCALWIVKMRRLPCCLPWVVGLRIVCDVFAIYMIDKQSFQNAMT